MKTEAFFPHIHCEPCSQSEINRAIDSKVISIRELPLEQGSDFWSPRDTLTRQNFDNEDDVLMCRC
jgi:hypothetical protein